MRLTCPTPVVYSMCCRIAHKRHLEAWVEKYEMLISINHIDLQDWQLQTIDVDISEAWNKK